MASQPIVITLRENETRLTHELTADQARHLAQLPPERLAVKLGSVPGEYWLEVGSHIGVIISEGLHIHIRPKVPIENLFYMLTYGGKWEWFDDLSPLGRSEDLFEFIVTFFVNQVDRIIRQGIQRGYVDFEEEHRFLRGRLLLNEHLRTAATRPDIFPQRTNEFTADLLENRILHETLNRLGRVSGLGSDLRRRLRRTASALAEVPPAHIIPADCDRVIYTRLNERYRPSIILARLLLQHLSLESHDGRTPFHTYLLPMSTIFEGFVARVLADSLADQPQFRVTCKETVPLDWGGRVTGNPDIVLRHDGQPVMVLDTKYKVYDQKPGNADIYQMAAYAQTLGVSRAVLIYPGSTPDDTFALRGGIRLDMRALPLTGSLWEFRAACRAFAMRFADEAAVRENP